MSDILQNIQAFFAYIKNLVTEIGTLFSRLISLLGFIPNYIRVVIHVLPGWTWGLLMVLLAVCILYKVLGREGNA